MSWLPNDFSPSNLIHCPDFIPLLFVLLFSAGLISCQSDPEQEAQQEAQQTEKVEYEKYMGEGKQEEQQTAKKQETEEKKSEASDQPEKSEDERFQDRLEQEVKKAKDRDASRNQKARMLFQKAQVLLDKGEYQEALETANQAVQEDPGYQKAKNLRQTLLNITGGEGEYSGRMTEQKARFKAKIEQDKTAIQTDLAKAKQLMKDKEYKKARDLLEDIEIRLRGAAWMESKDFQKFEKQVNNLLKKSKTLAEKREEQIQKKLRKKAQKKSLEEERKRQIEKLRWVDRLMEKAVIHFKQERYQEAIDTTKTVLSKYPNFKAAQELKRDARKGLADQWKKEYREEKVEQWKNFQKRMREDRVPFSGLLKYPSDEYWERVNQRARQMGPISPQKQTAEGRSIFSVKQKLESKKTTIEFVNAKLPEILETLRAKHDINIVLDREAQKQAEKKQTVVINEKLRLKNALTRLTEKYGLDYKLAENSVIVTTPENVKPEPELQVFQTRNLAYLLEKVPSFPSDNFNFQEYGGESKKDSLDALDVQFSEEKDEKSSKSSKKNQSTLASSGETKVRTKKGQPEAKEQREPKKLEKLVKNHVARDSWNRPGTHIRQAGGGMLFVRNTPDVLAKVEEFLQDIRSFAGSMVNVSVRFLNVRDEFLESFGVEFRNLSSDSGLASGLDGDIVPSSSNAKQTGLFSQGGKGSSAGGTMTPPGPGVDFRFFSNFPVEDDFENLDSTTLSNTGGLGLTYEVLDGLEYNAVLRALRKNERSVVVDSTHFTLFNTQRANISMSRQQAYIRDIDTQPAQDVTAFDPVIGVLHTGLKLDVRPIISFDRRYVTLQLLPSQASLEEIRDFTVLDTLGGDVNIQLPQIRFRKVNTTIRIPDKGAVIVGGLSRSGTISMEEGIPILEDIPIIGAIFQEHVDREVGNEIQILVNVNILNTKEIERKRFGEGSTAGITGGSGSGSE